MAEAGLISATTWVNLVSFGFITEDSVETESIMPIVGSPIVIVSGYAWAVKKTSIPQDEMFP